MGRSSASSSSRPVWGLDVGGTTAILGSLDADGRFEVLSELRTTPLAAPVETLRQAAGIVGDSGRGIGAIGIGVAGLVDFDGGIVLKAPNLPTWEGFAVREEASRLFGVPSVADNDCNVFAAGAVSLGEVPSSGLWIVITFGTGIGGSLVLDGAIQRGRGQAGEVGHMSIQAEGGLACPCGSSGCWERYAGREALLAYYRDSGGDPEDIEPRSIADRARNGCGSALEAFDRLGAWIGRGLANINNCFFPHGIAIGGGLTGAMDLWEQSARRRFRENAMLPVWNVVVLEAVSSTGALGAAVLASRLLMGREDAP
ncbi:ROK family protein [Candidatus Fermentibacterales bacterium]|nr:ROK family protein [Candidatus Fermentibacterales bacterium]